MIKPIRSIRNTLFADPQSFGRIPRRLVPPFRFVYLVVQEFSRNRCPEKASALGFQTVFSLIPAIVLAVSLFQLFGTSSDLGSGVADVLFRVLNLESDQSPEQSLETLEGRQTGLSPEEVSQAEPNLSASQEAQQSTEAGDDRSVRIIRENILTLVEKVYERLAGGGLNIISFAVLICAALLLALTLEKSLDEIWGSPVRRGFLRRIAVYWSVFTLGPVLIGLSLYATQQVSTGSAAEQKVGDLAIEVVGPLVALYLIYQLMPAAPIRPLPALAGAFVGAVLWKFAGVLFRLYLTTAVGYDRFYGNLGLIPVFLFWVWILWIILLVGAAVAYTSQNFDRLVAEERRRRGAPFVQPGLMALGLVLHAGRAFAAGKGPVTAKEIAHFTGLPDNLWLRLVRLLVDRGILLEAGPDRSQFTPGRPLDSLRVEEVFTAVEDHLLIRADEGRHPEYQSLRALAESLAKARQQELGKMSIAELLKS